MLNSAFVQANFPNLYEYLNSLMGLIMKEVFVSIARLFLAQLVILALALTTTPSDHYYPISTFQMIPHAVAATCGGRNQKPCAIWTGRKSCDRGLVENFAKGRCVDKPKKKPRPSKKKPPNCGRLNQKPCPVWTGRKSCNPGLVENFAKGRCVRPAPKPVPGKNCGLENQRPCPLTTGKKSCAIGLIEDFKKNRCVRPAANAKCGRLNQKPCPVWTDRQSCNPGLVEDFAKGRCVLPTAHNCGALDQRPCTINTGRQSCDPGLVEDFVGNVCIKPGQDLEQVKGLAKSCLNRYATVASALLPLSACMAHPHLQNTLRQPGARQNPGFMQQQIFAQCGAQVQQAFNTIASKGLRSLTIGLGGDLGGGLSANSELFLAFNTTLKGGIHKYASIGWRVGINVTAGAEVVVGAHVDNAANLAGTGQSISFGGKALSGVGVAAHTSFGGPGKTAQCTGISISPGVGVELNAGSVGRSYTVKVP